MIDLSKTIDEIIERLQDLKKYFSERTSVQEQDTRIIDVNNINTQKVSRTLSAIAHEDRIKILVHLYPDGKYFTELKEATGLTNSALYFHLKVLQERGIISQEFSRGKYLLTPLGEIMLSLIVKINSLL